MKAEYDLSKIKSRRNPYTKALTKPRKRVPVQAVTHDEVLEPHLRDVKFRKGYERELAALRKLAEK